MWSQLSIQTHSVYTPLAISVHQVRQLVSSQVGLGVFSSTAIPKGSFVCEYEGAVISHDKAVSRMETNCGTKSHNYVIIFKENYSCDDDKLTNRNSNNVVMTCIDGAEEDCDSSGGDCGVFGFGKRVNHSCDPNLLLVPVRVDSEIPHICMFAVRDIQPHVEQLCYSYSSGAREVSLCGKVCLCGAENCVKFLPEVIR